MTRRLQHLLLLLFMFHIIGLEAQSYQEMIHYLNHSNDEAIVKLSYVNDAIESYQASNHQDSLAMLYYQQSRMFFRGGVSIEKSIEALDNALDLINATDHRDLWIKFWYYKGYWYRKWDRYEEAKQALSEALKYTTDNEYLWDATIQLGKTFKDRGEFTVALEIYDRAIILAGEDMDKLSTTYEVIAFVYLIMDTKDGAKKSLPWLDKLLSLLAQMEGEEHFKASMTYNKGCAYMTLRDFVNAEKYFDEAEKIIDQCCDDNDFKSLLFESRAGLLVEQGEYLKALNFYHKSIDLYEHSFDLTRSDGLASSFRQIAVAHDKMGNPKDALKYITKALSYRLSGIDSQVDSVGVNLSNLQSNGEKHYLIDELLFKANILVKLSAPSDDKIFLEEANDILKYADEVVDFMRFEHIEESTKEFWRSKTSEVYSLLVKVNFKLGLFEDAFQYAEKSKFLLMGEHLIRKNNDEGSRFLPDDLRQQLRNVRAQIEITKEGINHLKVSVGNLPIDSLKKNLVELRKNEDDVLSKIKETYPDFFQDNFSFKLASVEDVRSNILRQGQSLIEFFYDNHHLYIFIIDESQMKVELVEMPFSLSDKLNEFLSSIAHDARNAPRYLQQYATSAHDLYNVTIGAAQKYLNDEIIIIADDVLALIPFSILLTESIDVEKDNVRLKTWPYLMKKYRLSYLKSASLGILQSQQNESVYFDTPILAINPSFESNVKNEDESEKNTLDAYRGGLQPLEGSEEEISFIKEQIDGSFFTEDNATEDNFKKALEKSYSIFHLASHAFVDDQNPEYSKIILNSHEDDSNDGLLHVYEIANLQINSDLVVLSACNTGFGKIQEGEGINSLGKAFARAGSPNLLMSLWPVNDQATSSLIKEYYHHIFEGSPKRKAIIEAKMSFLESVPAAFHHPYYWGGFVYYGDDKPLNLSHSKFESFGLILGVGIVLILFLIYKGYMK